MADLKTTGTALFLDAALTPNRVPRSDDGDRVILECGANANRERVNAKRGPRTPRLFPGEGYCMVRPGGLRGAMKFARPLALGGRRPAE